MRNAKITDGSGGQAQGRSPSGQESDRMPNATLTRMARERLAAFVAHIRPDGSYASRIYLSLKKVTEHIQHDYGLRFLIELIQNGYDAHESSEEAGEIAIRLVLNEAEYGVLYVANRGVGFTALNVEALCDVGLSDKPVGQTVGNKGLGFRSVLAISDSPEIFSRLPDSCSSQFDGFCFRFADESDFDQMLDVEAHREKAKRDLPRFHVPVPLLVQPGHELLRNLAASGFATVVRLPLRNKFALDAVSAAIEELRQSSVPILLFLRKLSYLSVTVEGGNPDRNFLLSRIQRSPPRKAGGTDRFELVDLDEFGNFFVAWRSVPEADIKRAIEKSIQQQELHESWSEWQGNGEVAVAVPIDQQDVAPRLYTYLPMGPDAEAPFQGFLHGSFYPKSDRTSMRAEIPLNELCLNEAVRLSATAIKHLVAGKWPRLPGARRPLVGQIVIDLMSWRQSRGISGSISSQFPGLMLQAFKELGVSLRDAHILPRVSSTRKLEWASSLELARWDECADLKVLSIASLVRVAKIAALPPSLGKDRMDRLEVFLRESGIKGVWPLVANRLQMLWNP